MKLITRIAFATLLTTGFSITAQAADVKAAPAPAQDPIVQHLKLTNDQVAKIKKACISSWRVMSSRFPNRKLKTGL